MCVRYMCGGEACATANVVSLLSSLASVVRVPCRAPINRARAPILLGSQLERTEAAVELVANPQLKEKAEQALPTEGVQQLERVDAMLGKFGR